MGGMPVVCRTRLSSVTVRRRGVVPRFMHDRIEVREVCEGRTRNIVKPNGMPKLVRGNYTYVQVQSIHNTRYGVKVQVSIIRPPCSVSAVWRCVANVCVVGNGVQNEIDYAAPDYVLRLRRAARNRGSPVQETGCRSTTSAFIGRHPHSDFAHVIATIGIVFNFAQDYAAITLPWASAYRHTGTERSIWVRYAFTRWRKWFFRWI